MKTKQIQQLICKDEVLKRNLSCENVAHLLFWECDVLSLGKSGFLSEFEVKVSRSDFLAEKKKIRKWELIQAQDERTCPNYFWYVCPKGLIKETELPKFAGLIYASEEGLLTIKNAPLLHKGKKDTAKVLAKFCRISAERIYLGGCMLTYKNKLSRT